MVWCVLSCRSVRKGLSSSDFFIVSAKKEGGVEWELMLGRKGWRRKGGREERDKC